MSARRNANRARCQQDGCEKFAQTRGLCKAHGGGSRCRDPSCNKLAQSRGLCIAHGGGRRCQHDGCAKLAQSKGFCISHGGGRRCTVADCEKFSQVKGRCKSHSKLAESSDLDFVEEDDGETESEQLSDRTMASPPPPPMTDQQYRTRGSPQSPTVDYSGHNATHRVDSRYLANPLARLHPQHSLDALPLPPPRSFGLSAGLVPMRQSLSLSQPPPPPAHHTVANRENVHRQYHEGYDHDMDTGGHHHHQRQHPGRYPESFDALKRGRSVNPPYQEDEELHPLPYSYIPRAAAVFGTVEEKRETHDPQHQSYFLLPSRYLQPQHAPTAALPSISHNALPQYTGDHFTTHSHHAPAVEPTSIPLLSFLDRNKDVSSASPALSVTQAMRAPSWTSTTTPMAAAPTERSVGTSPPLPSIVLPSLMRHNNSFR